MRFQESVLEREFFRRSSPVYCSGQKEAAGGLPDGSSEPFHFKMFPEPDEARLHREAGTALRCLRYARPADGSQGRAVYGLDRKASSGGGVKSAGRNAEFRIADSFGSKRSYSSEMAALRRFMSRRGGSPNTLLYSLLNCVMLSYPTRNAASDTFSCSSSMRRWASCRRSCF